MDIIEISEEYLVTDSGTSDGTQVKYFYDNKWYKVDRYGGEGHVEELASRILLCSNYPRDKYVFYQQELINGEAGCVSDNFLRENESFVTLYRLYSNIKGSDLATITSTMDYDDAIEYVISFVNANIGLDIREYLANTFALDALILNEDRHFNNLGVVFNGTDYVEAPIFDNGKSLFVGNKKYNSSKSMSENRKSAFAKAFSGNYELNASYLEDYRTIEFDKKRIIQDLNLRNEGDDPSSRLYRLLQ